MRAILGFLLAACVAAPTPSPSPTSTPLAVPTPTATTALITPAPSRLLAAESAYGWLVAGTSAAPGWKVRRENDPTALVTFSGDWPAVSPDGRSIAFWVPAGVRTQLRVVPASGGPERILLTLPSTERGETIAWAVGGSGLAVGVDATFVPFGGVDPPPSYSALRIIDLRTGSSTEIARRDQTRLRPFAWLRDRRVVLASEYAGVGRSSAYIRAGEDGKMVRDPLDMSASGDCTHVSEFRLDTNGTIVMSVQPQTCMDGSGKLVGGALIREWSLDQGPAQAQVFDLGPVFLSDAQFRPGAPEFVTATQQGAALIAQVWQGRSSRVLTTIALQQGLQPNPLVFRPNSAVLLLCWPSQPAANTILWHGRLVDVTSDTVTDIELGGDRPIASVYLGP